MLAVAHRRFGERGRLINASAEALPLESGSFDHLTFTYLLRYVADPAATLAELARVVRPGGVVASLEFGVPAGRPARSGSLYVARCCRWPAACCGTAGGRSATSSAGRSATSGERHPLERQLEWWHAAGLDGVEVAAAEPRRRRRHLGTEDVSRPTPAEAASPRSPVPVRPGTRSTRGGWRDYVTLLHPPYTAWHLSYVVIGGCLAPVVRLGPARAPPSPRSPSRSGSVRTPSTS